MSLIRWSLAAAVVAIAATVCFAIYARIGEAGKPAPASIEIRSEVVPNALRTPGGLLEVSRIMAPAEVLERTDSGSILGFDFGSNVSRIRVSAVYRYHISLGDRWTIIRHRDRVYVVAPRPVPTLPVAIDTETLRQHTDAGWLRFDKDVTAKAALAQLTQVLGNRAATPSYIGQQREVARKTVAEFVGKWGVSPLNTVPPANVKVVFDDEPVRSLIDGAFPAAAGAP